MPYNIFIRGNWGGFGHPVTPWLRPSKKTPRFLPVLVYDPAIIVHLWDKSVNKCMYKTGVRPSQACWCPSAVRSSSMRREPATTLVVRTNADSLHSRDTWYASSWRHAHLFTQYTLGSSACTSVCTQQWA